MKKWLYVALIALVPLSLHAKEQKEKKKESESGYAYMYKKEVQGNTTTSKWTITEKGHTYEMKGQSPVGKTTVIANKNLDTLCFDVTTSSGGTGKMTKDKGMLYASKHTASGDEMHRSYKALKSIPWIQELNFSFRPFILSNDKSFKFQIINPKNLSIHTLVSTKVGTEQLELHGTKYDTIRVKMTLTGFEKMFWGARVWYDSKTGDLVKYIANEGPGTPVSTLTLFSRKKL